MASQRKGESREAYLARRKNYDRMYEHRRNLQARSRGYSSRGQERHYREKIRKELHLPELPEPQMKPTTFPELPPKGIVLEPTDILQEEMTEREKELERIIEAMGFNTADLMKYEGDWQKFLEAARAEYGRSRKG